MASRHEIISIDFRANAAKANPAMDALREAAKNMRTEVEKTKTAISDGIKTGKSQEELDKLGAKLRTQERELKSFETAMNTLAKGVTTLSRAIDAFNTGTLEQMSAAFQKASYNAAETAKKALLPGTKDYQKNMAELDALQQKNLENLAKYKLRTEQMLQSIGKEGSKISSQDLKQEADGIQELMRLLPHMSHEWLEYYDILKQVNAAIKQQTDDEKRLTGAIVDVNDARERSSQLTRKGVEDAARQRKEAEEEVKQRTENIAALKAERAEKAKQVSIDAANAIAKDKEVEKQRKVIAGIKERIDNEKKDAERKQKNIDKLNQEATAYENNAKSFREAAETMKTEVKGIDDELKQVNEELAKMGGAAPAAPKNPVLEGVKQGAEEAASATEKVSEAVKTTAEAARHEVKGLSTSIEELKQKKEELEGRRREAWFKAKEAAVEITGIRNRFGGSFDPTEEGRKAAVAKDKEAADAVVKAMEEKWDAFWTKQEEQAKLFAQKLGKELDDVDFSDFHEHILDHGKMGEYAKSWYRNFMNEESELVMTADGSIMKQRRELAKSYEDDPDASHYRAELSLIESLHRKNSEYWKEHDRAGRIADGWTEGENAKLWEQYSPKYIHYSEVLSQKNKEKRDIDSQLVSVQKNLNEVSGKGAEVVEKSAAAKKEETKATEENAAAKEKEVKAGETAAKAAENEKVTLESLIKRNDELKIKIAALIEERKQMLATQEKNAAAVKEEANAYKDLSKEQAQAMLDQKQQLATFKKEGEKWQIGNREEAQRYLFDALGEINPANVGKTTMSIESSPEKISQLLGKFQERYGIEGEGEAMAAVRELMSGGGLVKSGFMNKFFMNVEQDTPKVAAFSKEIKDLTAVINGEVKAVEEDTEKKRTLADVEAELKTAEEESRDISIQTMKMRNGQADATEGLTQKTVRLTDAQKERIATIKAETESIRQMSQEEAKAALDEAKKVSTVGYKGGKLHMSDPEEVQQFLIGKMRTIGKVKNDNGTLSLAGGQVDALVSAFQQRYDWKGDKTNAKALLKKILQGKDGMFMGGTADLSGDVGSVTIQYAKEMYDARIERAKALVDVSNGVKKATDEVSDATRRGADAAKDATEATNGQTDAIKQQEAEVMRRKAAFDKMNEEYEQADKKLKDMRQRYASLPSSGMDAGLAKDKLKDDIDDYNENVVKKLRADKNRLKNLWEQSVSDLTKMMGISTEETQESTDAQNQESEAVERGTKSRGRKKKAVEDATQAVREEAKAEGDAAKQGEQLSEQDRKRIALEQKQQELETKRGQKIDEIKKKEEAADDAEVRANNNRSKALQMTEELSQAHGKNADAMGKATDELKKMEFEQDGLNKKADEGRKALAEYDQKIDDNAEKRLEAQKKQAQSQRLTIDTMTEAIKVLEASNRAIEPESKEWVKNARLIRQYQAELDRLKQQPVLDMMTQRMGNIRNLSADALQETKKFWQGMITGAEHGSTELKEYERNLEKVAKEEEKRRQEIQAPMRKRLNNLEKLSTADLAETKRYWETVRDGVSQTSAAYKKAELAVKALTNEENRRKANVQAQYINEQMRDLNNLSTAGLTEVKRYWQAMADGAKRGSDEARDAEAALKRINEIESERRRTADKQQVRTLFGDLSKKNGEEIRAAIEAGRRLIDTYDSGGPAAKRLSQAILDAEEHLKQYGIEAERSARREAQALEEAAQRRKEQDQLMRQQLDQGTSLSESALKTQQQYWQRLIDDPKTAKESLAGYRYELERTIALQEQQASVTREERAARLNGDLNNYSEAEIREAIEAGKQLVMTYKSGSDEAEALAQRIVVAETHIKQYGVEAARAAAKEAEAVRKAADEELEKRKAGGIVTSDDAMRLSNNLTKEAIELRQRLAQVEKDEATESREAIENALAMNKQRIDTAERELDVVDKQLKQQREMADALDEAKRLQTDLPQAEDDYSNALREAIREKGVWNDLNNDVINITVRLDELKEKLANTSNLKEQQKILADIKTAEDELTTAKEKAAAQDEKVTAAREKEYEAEVRVKKIKEDVSKVLGGRDYDMERDKLDNLENKHEELTETLQREKQEHENLSQAVVSAQEREVKAAIELAQSQNVTQESIENAIAILEKQHKQTAENDEAYNKQTEAIGRLRDRLSELKGEWMSLTNAQEIASKAGTAAFAATPQEIQQATHALERRREELIKQIRAERDLGNAVDAQEKELDDLTKKLRSLKFEQDNVNMSQEKMRTLIETPANAVNLDELRAAIKRADGQLRQMQQSLGENSSEYKRFAEQVRQAKNVMKEMEGQAKASATAWEKAFSRLKTYVVMYMGFNEVWQKVSNTARDLMDLSDRMGEVGKTTQMTAEQIERLTLRLRDLDTRTSIVALTELSAKAGQLGLKTEEDVMGFTEAANKMLVALPEMGADGATQMMKVALATGEVDRIGKEMQQGFVEGSSATAVAMEKIASTIDQLRANSAAAAPQITDFVKRVGAVGAQSGISIDQVAALGSTVDALGMRVEMSATALSRMIPAIRNNAFEVAKAIGMTPNALRDMFDEAGGGMQAMLAIFQHIKDAGMTPDDIEKMLGMGGMQDIMKDLNQQGARAGIVFAGLSQNVDVLREHLGIAHQAYEDNVAIQQEYDRMNETTAARWERLKNQFEEMWVGPAANNMLGGVIDALRVIVDLISGPLNTAFNSTIIAVTSIKSGLTGIPAAIGSAFDYMRNSAAQASTAVETASKATQIINTAASVTETVSEATEKAEGAADIVGSVSDALSEAKEAGEQAGEAVENASGAIGDMGAATKMSIFSVKGLTAAWKGLDTTMKVNILVAVASALWTIGKMIWDMVNEADAAAEKLAEDLNKLDEEEEAAERSVRSLMNAYDLANKKAEEATQKQAELEQQTEALRKEVDALKGSKDKSTASSDALTKKEEELKRAEELLKQATKESVKANGARLDLINEINSKYSTYLGYMLDEKTAAQQVALAHLQIVDALKEELEQKRLNKEQESIDEQASEGLGEARKSSQASLSTLPKDMQRRITSRWNEIRGRMVYAEDEEGRATYTLPAIEGLVARDITKGSYKDLRPYLQRVFRNIVADEIREAEKNTDRDGNRIRINLGTHREAAGSTTAGTTIYSDVKNTLDDFVKQAFRQFDTWTERTIEREEKLTEVRKESESYTSGVRATSIQHADKANAQAYSIATKTLGTISSNQQLSSEVVRKLAQQANVITANLKKFDGQLENADKYIGKGNEATLQNAVDTMYAKLSEQQRRQILSAAQKTSKISDESGGGAGGGDNIWGNRLPAESTDWKNMTAEQLVNRRKQMADFVNAIQTDTDVKAVLEEDAALKKAIEKGMSSDMRTVIEWYNTERLKIQDELHARHLTNTGDWLDPKKERMRKKQLQDEWNMYLREIDAYYTERKTRIEEAGTDEGLTEAEIRNRTLANEMEWRQRRAELQKLYADKNVEVTAEEQQAIFDIISERTGDDVKYVKAQIASTVKFMKDIGKMSEKELKEALSKLGLGWERDFLKQQQAVTQQMKAIQDIIDKERPFNGITKQLRESLATMDILTGDMRERYKELLKTGTDEEKKRFNEEQNREEMRRTSFLLGEAEQAYSTTIDRVMQQMREKGMTAWADWLSIRPEQQEALMAQLRQTYDGIQDAIKKEASQLKKQAEIMWNNILVPGGDGKTTMKQMLDRTVAQLGIDQGRVSRANSLIGAGASSERVADKLAIQQMRLQLTMQEHYYNLMKKQGRAHVDMLNQQADAAERRGNAEEATRKRLDAQHAEMALNLATAKEETELAKQREEIIARTEESQNRLYTSLREWADLLTSSLQGVFEASHAGDAEYYNERAKLNLTGKGGPGAGTYVVIDDAGTSDATAHYEYLDERQALERQHEIEVQNAQAEAWKKLWDDINMKMSEQITDWMNAALQNQSIDANTQAVIANTEALWAQLGQTGGQQAPVIDGYRRNAEGFAVDEQGQTIAPVQPVEMPTAEGETPAWKPVWQMTDEEREVNQEGIISMWQTYSQAGNEAMAQMSEAIGALPNPVPDPVNLTPESAEVVGENAAAVYNAAADAKIAASDRETQVVVNNSEKQKKAQTDANNQTTKNTQSSFAKMATAANMYGIAYQTMSNDNLSTAQKFQVFALQAAGQAAISMLTMDLAAGQAKNTVQMPGILGKLLGEMPYPAAIATFAGITALMGGLMALAMSSVTKSKSQIAQVSGTSVGAGRLSTGMLTYAEGNVNELTDPASLTPGRQYNVDGADGKTYRARYMGKGAKTHITNGPEFHLVGEAGREAIIDAKTTRLLQMNETGIWRDIQTLYNGGSISGLSTRRRRGTGVRAFADGNVGDFEEMADGGGLTAEGTGGMGMEQMLTALDRNSAIQEALLERLNQPIYAQNILYGPDGLPNVINKLNKEAQRHGEKYL